MLTSFLSLLLVWPLRGFVLFLIVVGLAKASFSLAILAIGLFILAAYINYAASHTVRVRK